jgi:RNA polymerase sigma-70 factor (ECF subfamily)
MPSIDAHALAPVPVAPEERHLLSALRRGDERAFEQLVTTYGPAMRRIARGYVSSDTVADEVVQDTWMAVFTGLGRFEERSSLRTWIFQILINRAKTTGIRDRRMVPFSSLDPGDEGPVVSPDRFLGSESESPGRWSAPPRRWCSPEVRLLSLEARERLRQALESLPRRQQLVVTMRDVEGLDAEEVCGLLEISSENQRVLLHRGRSALRGVLESYVDSHSGMPTA